MSRTQLNIQRDCPFFFPLHHSHSQAAPPETTPHLLPIIPPSSFLSQAQAPHKVLCVCLTTCPDSRTSSRGRIMICSRGGGNTLQWCTPAYSGGYFSALLRPRLGSLPLHQFSPLNWPIPTSLHKESVGNLSHWLFSHAKKPNSESTRVPREATSQNCLKSHSSGSRPEGEKERDPPPPQIAPLSRIVRLAITCWTCFEFACYRKAARSHCSHG
ncbi:hypothetical protein QBC45DRAFT_19974 [Copromyces sp. CBS 386.78]|nr:hypothetical protein QBC45DRAFT_19974 [Copromyces sp. CBS 386.78]